MFIWYRLFYQGFSVLDILKLLYDRRQDWLILFSIHVLFIISNITLKEFSWNTCHLCPKIDGLRNEFLSISIWDAHHLRLEGVFELHYVFYFVMKILKMLQEQICLKLVGNSLFIDPVYLVFISNLTSQH